MSAKSGKQPGPTLDQLLKQWPLDALVGVARNTLFDGGHWLAQKPGPEQYGPPLPAEPPPSLADEDNARIYPFTKGIDITNDGIGYGEETTVLVRCADGESRQQRRRRTRTGTVALRASKPKPTTKSARTPTTEPTAPDPVHPGDEGDRRRPRTEHRQ